MITKLGFRALLEANGSDYGRFSRHLTHLLGLTDRDGRYHEDAAGNRVLRDPADGQKRLSPSEISVRALTESLLGEDWDREIKRVSQWIAIRELMEHDRTLLEDNGAGAVGASSFANINAFTAATAGLLEAGILEAYESPEFVGDRLAPAEPSRQFEGRRTIGVARLGDQAEERLPGMPTKRVQFGDRWIEQPRTVENALSCELTQEAIYLDLTGGQVSEQGNSVGDWLAYRKELRVIDSLIGLTQSYNYKGNAYQTFSAGGFIDNDLVGNDLEVPQNIMNAELKFRDMTDPETGTRIRIAPNTVIVQKEREIAASLLFGGDVMSYQTAPVRAAGAQQIRTEGPNIFRARNYQILSSPLIFERVQLGLGVSYANAGRYWWLMESGPRSHVYVQNWPLRTQTAAPNQVDMIDRGIVLYVKADERGVPMWKDPRRAVRCRPA